MAGRARMVWIAGLFVVVAIGGWLGVRELGAEPEASVGYVNNDLIVDAHAGEQFAAVVRERDRLQQEFNAQSADLDEGERQTLFGEYETRLQAYEDQLGIASLLAGYDAAMEEVMVENDVTIILDVEAVVHGGVDLTEAVLQKLGIRVR